MPPPSAETFLAFHPQDNNIIAIGMDDSSIQIYNVQVDEVEPELKTKLKGHQKRITSFSFSNALNVLVSSGFDSQGRVASEIKHVKPMLTSRVSVAQEKRDMISEASKGSGTKPRVRVNDIPVRSKAEKKTPDRVAQNKCSMLKMPNYEEEAELEEDERSDEESEEESGEEVEAERVFE
ncbi:WD repeat domain-containing protein [Forsythia ovata]|uniref:WD repeat domain-containing protein n=1 Tax=Forsythia ovata TaxID=205694 RepID=A0ABD1XA08_9LAMI